jgi:hypothetical protein
MLRAIKPCKEYLQMDNTNQSPLALILAAMRSTPAKVQTALEQMVLDVAEAEGFDYTHATAGRKAAFTRRVKEAVKAAGITL